MAEIILFYISCYWVSFLLGIPIGPVNLEIFHNAVQKHFIHAVMIAIGAAFGDAIWAMCAFFGISPFVKYPKLEPFFFLFTAAITFGLGLVALKNSRFIEKKEEKLVSKIKRKRWSLLKGLTMVLVNPLGVISWMICLQFLRKNKIFIPLELRFEVLFFVVVTAGAASYFFLVVFITNKMKKIFNHKLTGKVTKLVGYLLFVFSIYFLFYAVKAFFFNNHALPPG
jgi:threonine/homoserine/homoserine lactone efflux protein